nr:MAG TPA: hypothetical protein [Caudoviricetes sp.]
MQIIARTGTGGKYAISKAKKEHPRKFNFKDSGRTEGIPWKRIS